MKIPLEIAKLRKLVKDNKINPAQKYSLYMGNGEVVTYTGAQIIETAKSLIALADAQKTGSLKAMTKAIKRIEGCDKHGTRSEWTNGPHGAN